MLLILKTQKLLAEKYKQIKVAELNIHKGENGASQREHRSGVFPGNQALLEGKI